jgi:hypothetical protein
VRLSLAVGLLALAVLGACKPRQEPMPKTEAEKSADGRAVRDNAVWGAQVQALDKAKAIDPASSQAADEARRKIDEAIK